MISIEANTDDFLKQMRRYARKEIPHAVRGSLLATGDAIVNRAKRNVKKDLIVRTPFTLNSIRVLGRPRGTDIGRMFCMVGSISRYLAIHDEGGVRPSSKGEIPSPTTATRTGGNERRRISPRYRMDRAESSGAFRLEPAGGKLKHSGIFIRKRKALVLLRLFKESQYNIKGVKWFSDPVKRYGNSHFIQAQFRRIARHILDRKGVT